MIQHALRALLLILAIAGGTYLAWQLMSPVVPTLVVITGLLVVFIIIWQIWRR